MKQTMFHSARLKLTLFYLAILLLFSLLLTWGFRAFVGAEIRHANDVQRGAVHDIGQQFFDNLSDDIPQSTPDQDFARVQRNQNSVTQGRLNRETLLLNIGVLVVGACLSYWYAGRTLKPIEEAHERQKRFTSDASHELRTPLASMRLENEIFLRQKKFKQHEAEELIKSNLEEVDRLERLTTSLLALNRYENESLPLAKLSPAELVMSAIEHTQHTAVAKQITFDQSIADATILGDQESLVQLISILLDNATKYGLADGTIIINGSLHGDVYEIDVLDNGAGIPADDLPHIFERLYRGDKARSSRVSGHGIGLSLAQQIAVANRAGLSAGNRPEGGAIFRITLPKA